MGAFGSYREVLANRPLARLFAGEFVSRIGDWLYMVAILVLVWTATRDAFLLGVVGVVRLVPLVILAVPAGTLADRFDRRLILLTTDILRAVLMLVIAVLVASNAPIVSVVVVAIAASSVAAFFGPAIAAYIPRVAGDESQLGPANSLWAALDNAAFIIGPAVAGLLIAIGGLQVAFLLNAASFGMCAVLLTGLPSGRPDRASVAPESGSPAMTTTPAAGWRQVGRLMAGPIALDVVTSVAGGVLSVLTVVIAVDALGAGEAATGYLNAAVGVGGVVAGIAAGALTLRRLDGSLIGAAILGAVVLAGLGVSRDVSVAMVAMGVGAGALLVLDVVNVTLVQRLVPDALRGRAMGLLQTTGVSSYAAASFFAPLFAQRIGLAATFAGLAVGLISMALVAVALLAPTGVLRAPAVDPERVRLLQLPVFAGLSSDRLESIARRLTRVPVTTGQDVVRQGDAPDRFYLVASGTLDVTESAAAGERIVRHLGPGDVFGELGLLTGRPRSASVRSTTDSVLWALDARTFRDLVAAGPGLSARLLDLYQGTAPAP